jgi:hypothetical protein
MAKNKNVANRITKAKARKIYKLFHLKEMTIPQIMEEEAVTYWQVYRIISGVTKLDGTNRRDKGVSRKSVTEAGQVIEAKWSIEDFKDLDDFQLFLLMSALEDAASSNLDPIDKVRLVKDIETVQSKITQRQLRGNIRRPDAEVISRIIRRFKPEATNTEIINIYKEEAELYMRERVNEQ